MEFTSLSCINIHPHAVTVFHLKFKTKCKDQRISMTKYHQPQIHRKSFIIKIVLKTFANLNKNRRST